MFPEDLEASKSKCSAKTTKVRSLSSQIKQIKKEWLGDPTALSEESHPIAAPCDVGHRTSTHFLFVSKPARSARLNKSSANLVRCTSRSHSPRGSIFVYALSLSAFSKEASAETGGVGGRPLAIILVQIFSMVVQYLSNIGIHFKSFSWIFRVCVSQKNLHRKVLEPFTVSGVSDSILVKAALPLRLRWHSGGHALPPHKKSTTFLDNWNSGNAFLFWFPSLSSKMFEVWIWLALVAAVPMLSWQANKLSLADGQVYWNTNKDQLGTIAVHQNGEQKVATRWIIMTIVDGDSWWLIRWSPHQRYENISLVVIQKQKDEITKSFRCLK